MKFRYLATSPRGSLQKGEIEASSLQEAIEKLKEKSLIPLEIKKSRSSWRLKFKKEHSEELLLFTEQLQRLLKAGVPLNRALGILARVFNNTGKETLEQTTLNIKQEIEKGHTLSETLEKEELFPEFYVSLVRAGEVSGALDTVLEDLARYLKEREEFKRELISALLYPCFLLFFGIFAVQTVLVYILPRFAVIFDEMGVNPPFFTQLLISIGIFWRKWGWLFLLFLLVAFFYIRTIIQNPNKRAQLEQYTLKLPVLGRLWLLAELARIFRALGVMIKGGVSIDQALKMVSSVPKLYILRNFFQKLAEDIKRGQPLSKMFRKLPVKADFVLDLVSIGEETGNLATSFLDISDLCEEEVRLGTKRFLTILEPATILFFGLLLGTIIVSILVAIFDLRIS